MMFRAAILVHSCSLLLLMVSSSIHTQDILDELSSAQGIEQNFSQPENSRPEINQNSSISENILFEGRLEEFDFAHPTTNILIASANDRISIQLPSAVELRRMGWTSDILYVGEYVRVSAKPRNAAEMANLGTTFSGNEQNLTATQPDSTLNQALNLDEDKNTNPLVPSLTASRPIYIGESVERANGDVIYSKKPTKIPSEFQSLKGGMYSLDRQHSHLSIQVDHQGFSNITSSFDQIEGNILWNRENHNLSFIQLSWDTDSLHTRDPELTRELTGPYALDALNSPKIGFKSTSINVSAWGDADIHGQLTIKGVTQPIIWKTQVIKLGHLDNDSDFRAGIVATTKISTQDWGFLSPRSWPNSEWILVLQGEFVHHSTIVANPSLTAGHLETEDTFNSL